MKDYIKISYLTKFGVFYSLITAKLWTFKHGSKSMQTSQMLRWRPQKPYEFSKIFLISVIYLKIDKNRNFQLRFIEMVAI